MIDRSGKKKRRNRQSNTKAKNNFIYDRKDVMRLYDVCRNTVINWIKNGLESDDNKNRYFTGRSLNAFHKRKNLKAEAPCNRNEFYCTSCKGGHPIDATYFRFKKTELGNYSATSRCSNCGRRAFQYISADQLAEIQADACSIPEQGLETNMSWGSALGLGKSGLFESDQLSFDLREARSLARLSP